MAIIALLLAIPTVIGIVIAWYWLVNWGEIRLKPRYGDHMGFILAAIVIPIVFVLVIAGAATMLGRAYGAYLLGAVMLSFAAFGVIWLYIRFIWRD